EPEVVVELLERGGKKSIADKEPHRTLSAHKLSACEAAERSEDLQPFVEPRLVQPRPAGRQVTDVMEPEQDQTHDENRLPEPQNRMGTEVSRSFHDLGISAGLAVPFTLATRRYTSVAAVPSSPRNRMSSASSA